MFGKSLAEYVRLQSWILVAIVAVWAARFGLSLAGSPAARWASVTWVLLIGSVYYGIVGPARGFGRFKQLYPPNLIQGVLSGILVAVAIAVAIFTGQDNIYTVPEFSGGQDGKNWFHAFAHVVLAGAIVVPLLGWLVSSIAMFVTKRVSPARA